MLQVAILGLGTLGVRILEELYETGAETIIVDKDKPKVEEYKHIAKSAYITDVVNEKALKEIIPTDIDAVILDMGDNFEATIMTTNYLHKLGIKKIIVEAHDDEKGEVLKLVGATQIVYPELEAARHLTPMLHSSSLFNFMQLSGDFALAEISVTDFLDGKKLTESNLRNEWNLNVVAYRKLSSDDFSFINSPDFVLSKEYTILVAGDNKDILNYLLKTGNEPNLPKTSFFSKMFKAR